MVMLSPFCWAESPKASAAATEKVFVPTAVGLPVMAPAVDKLSPAGREEPLASEYVSVPAPPVAATLPVYEELRVPAGRVGAPKRMAGAGAMVMLKLTVVAVSAVGVPESVTVKIKLL